MSALPETATAAPGTLLFVDDEANILASLHRLFRPDGYRIFTAASGGQGLAVLEKEAVDLVISDMRMPEMDGASFLEQVAQRWPQVVRLLLTGYADIASTIAAVNRGGIYRYLQKPWEQNDLRLTVQRALEGVRLERERQRLEALAQEQNAELRRLASELEARVAARTESLRRAMEGLNRSYRATVECFANLIEARAGGLGPDTRQAAAQAQWLALHLALGEGEAQNVLYAGLLQDIGKIGLSDELLNKPYHDMVAEERAQLAKHPVAAQSLLVALEPLQEAAKLIRSRHERFDGKGYPDGLSGEAIALGARVLAVVSDYHELQKGLIVPERLTPAQAKEFLREHRGSRYDPRVVDTFVELLRDTEPVTTGGEVRLRADALQPGMVLTRDLLTRGRLLLLARGHVLDDALIAKLQDMEAADEGRVFYVQAQA